MPANSTCLDPDVSHRCTARRLRRRRLPTPDWQRRGVLNGSGQADRSPVRPHDLADRLRRRQARRTGRRHHRLGGLPAGSTSFETAPLARPSRTRRSTRSVTPARPDNNRTDFAAPATASPTAASRGRRARTRATAPRDKSGPPSARPSRRSPSTATGGTSPYSWTATGLPAGLTIGAATGEVTGTPTAAGTFNVTVDGRPTRLDATGHRHVFKLTVNPAGTSSPIAERPGHRRGLAAPRAAGHHAGHRHRRLPGRRLLRVLHPDPRHRRRQHRPRHPHRVRRRVRAADHRDRHRIARQLRRGHRHRR